MNLVKLIPKDYREIDTSEYLLTLYRDTGGFEISTICSETGEIVTIFYESWSEIINNKFDSGGKKINFFTTLNSLDFRKIKQSVSWRTRNDHVVKYKRLFFDFDPVREGGSKNKPASDDELFYAFCRALSCAEYLRNKGFPLPAIALSGNGAHLQYRADIVAYSSSNIEAIKMLYEILEQAFGDRAVSFDTTVSNPARLCCLYGTTKYKGEESSEETRLYRKSRIFIPPSWQTVENSVIADLVRPAIRQRDIDREIRASIHRKRSSDRSHNGKWMDAEKIDAVRWFMAHGHYIRQGVRHGEHIVKCPWSHLHSNGIDIAYLLEPGNGYPMSVFYCFHNHCQGQSLHTINKLWGDGQDFCHV